MITSKTPHALRAAAIAIAVACCLLSACAPLDSGDGLARLVIPEGGTSLTEQAGGSSVTYSISLSETGSGFEIETIDAFGADLDVSLAGLEADHDFAFEYADPEKAAAILALESIVKAAGVTQLDSVPAWLSVTGGAYRFGLLRETISRGDTRVVCEKLADTDYDASLISGGYILYVREGRVADGEGEFASDLGLGVKVRYPKGANANQLAYVSRAWGELEYALAYGKNLGLSLPVEGESLADRYLLSLLLGLTPGEGEDALFVKRRASSRWIPGPFKDVADSPLLDSDTDIPTKLTAGRFMDALASVDSVQALLTARWARLRASALSDASFAEAIQTARDAVGLSQPSAESLGLYRNLTRIGALMDASFK